jgi:excisionase family DNA binding protein
VTEALTEAARTIQAQLHDIETVQARLNCGRSTVFELIKTRELRSVKVGRRRLVTEASLVEFIERLDKQAGA